MAVIEKAAAEVAARKSTIEATAETAALEKVAAEAAVEQTGQIAASARGLMWLLSMVNSPL